MRINHKDALCSIFASNFFFKWKNNTNAWNSIFFFLFLILSKIIFELCNLQYVHVDMKCTRDFFLKVLKLKDPRAVFCSSKSYDKSWFYIFWDLHNYFSLLCNRPIWKAEFCSRRRKIADFLPLWLWFCLLIIFIWK
jgi:hypothetical protein